MMSLDLLGLLRAKSEGEQALLKDHLFEALKKVEELKKFIENNKIEIKNFDDFFSSLAIAVIIHDLGKINYKFQKEVYKKDSEKWSKAFEEFLEPSRGVKIRHEILSAIWASILLPDNDEWSRKIRTSVLLHHYNEFYIGEKDLAEIVLNYFDDVENYLEFISKKWNEFELFLKNLIQYLKTNINDELLKTALERINISKKRVDELLDLIGNKGDLIEFADFYEIENDNPDYEFLFFMGCLRRCDYSASGNINIERDDVVLEKLYHKIESNIKEKINASLWQKKLLENANGESIVLVAPTGAGKTEFAILWAKNTGKKLIYTLPLRVALNDIFKRFNDYTPNNDENVGLLHSTAFMEYVTEERSNLEIDVEKKILSANLLSYPLILSTPDQVFLTSLNYYGSDKIISVYPLSAFVIDEIQTYNPEMASIVIKTLKIIEKLGGKILVMTATLPPYFEPFFFENSGFINEIDKKYKKNYDNYRINLKKLDTAQIKDNVKNYTLRRHKIKVIENKSLVDEDLNVKEGLMEYLNKLKNSGKRNNFIVVNTVSKAIKIYEYLKKKINEKKFNSNVFLLHSRLIEKEKDRKIKLIKLLIKKQKSKEDIEKIKQLQIKNENINIEFPITVVATQIIEASVDLDFDGMITEISPIDSQIQRWGRVYRKPEKRGNKDYNGDPNIYIFAEIDRRTKSIYSGDTMKKVLEESVNVLKEFENKKEPLSYEDERQMVELVFKKEINGRTIMADFISEICKSLDFLKYFSAEKRSEAQRLFRNIAGFQVVIPSIMKLDNSKQYEKLAEILSSAEQNITWADIEKEIGIDKWRIKKILYQHSISVPTFFLQPLEKARKISEFKGFYILNVNEEDARIIYEFGLDKFMKDKMKEKDEEEILESSIL